MEHKDKSPLFMALLTVGLYFSGVFVFLTPLPFVYLLFKRGMDSFYRPVFFTVVAVCGVYALGLTVMTALYDKHPGLAWILPIPSLGLVDYFSRHIVMMFGIGYFASYVFISFSIAKALARPERLYRYASWSVIALFAIVLAINAVLVIPHAEKLLADYSAYMAKGVEQLIAMQDKEGVDNLELVYLKSNVDELIRYTLYLLPAFLFSSIASLYVLNLVLAKRLFSPFFPALVRFKLTAFRVPFSFVWCSVATVTTFLLNVKFFNEAVVHFLTVNVLVVIGTAYFFQGFAIFMHFLDDKRVFGLVRMGVYVLLLVFIQASILFFVSLGFFDNWLDVRKLDRPEAKT
jgi:hypothetical protein